MNINTLELNKLYIDIYPEKYFDVAENNELPQSMISFLDDKNIKTIICVLPNDENIDYYDLKKLCLGFDVDVTGLVLDSLDPGFYKSIEDTIIFVNENIGSNSILLLPFSTPHYAFLLSLLVLVYKGASIEDAIDKVSERHGELLEIQDSDYSFIQGFIKFTRGKLRENFKQVQEEPAPIDYENITERVTILDETDKGINDIQKPIPANDAVEGDIIREVIDYNESRIEDEIPQDEYKEDTIKELETGKEDKKEIVEQGKIKTKSGKETYSDKSPASSLLGLRNTIRTKLISIISLIILFSLSLMIFLATYFFRADNEIRIKESNHKISSAIELSVRASFLSTMERARLIAATMLQRFSSPSQKRYFTNLFFKNERDYLFVGIVKKSGNSINLSRSIYNENLMNEKGIQKSSIRNSLYFNTKSYLATFEKKISFKNISHILNIPVISIAIPFESSGNVDSIVVIYVKLEKFLPAFKSTGITETFMINDLGDVLAHQNPKFIMSNSNFINLPIVKAMLKSKLDNGQKRYEDSEGTYYFGSFKKLGIGGVGIIATVQEEMAFQVVYKIQRRNIIITLIILNFAVLIVYFFGKTLTTPILRLVNATKKIEEGIFSIDILPTSGDEIGTLTKSFISMGKGLEEREKMKEAFGKFVNKEIAEQAMKGEIKLGGERKNVAVFFSDIRSFTAISERLEPEEVVVFLNKYMTKMVNCVNITKGVVDKYIGDAIMAIWGAPVSRGNDTENAINASLLMRNELIDFNKDRGSERKPIIKIGCGINTGAVLAGQIGSDDRMEYTVIGDTVNLASRIEALNKPFGTDILISQDSYDLVEDIYLVEKMDKIKVKGKNEPQQIYAVLGRKDDPDSPKTLDELRTLMKIEVLDLQRRASDKPAKIDEENKHDIIKE
ncbi:adenylate/guanylate cyclase domain-containing protein [Spirochaetota bacterium]